MSRRNVKARAQEIAKLKRIIDKLENDHHKRLVSIEGALAKAIGENFSMARAIRDLQGLDADRVKIINLLDSRINNLEKPVGFWAKLIGFGRKWSTVCGIIKLNVGGTMIPKQGETYIHFKGGLYEIASVENDIVKYRSWSTGVLWSRSLEEFTDYVFRGFKLMRRFERLE